MKNLNHLVFFTFFLFSNSLFATHNRAGEIIYEQINATTIKASIITFTKTSSGAADRDSVVICWGDGNCEFVLRVGEEILENNFKRNVYTKIHEYNAMGNYKLSMTDPNRNGNILNVNPPNSDNVGFHIESEVNLNANNNSPTLLMPPVDIAFVGQTFFHNPTAFDIDGDSIAYELVTPMSDKDIMVANYSLPSLIQAGANNNISLDPTTGDLIWESPQQAGEYSIAIKIKEYRNGNLIATMIRDMQIVVMKKDELPPSIELVENNSTTNDFIVNYEITAKDAKNPIKITAFGGPFEIDAPATFSAPTDFQMGTVTAQFQWLTNSSHVREQPYQVVFKAENNILGTSGMVTLTSITIDLTNQTTTSVAEIEELFGLKFYPNPTHDQLTIELNRKDFNQKLNGQILNLNGQALRRFDILENDSKMILDINDLPQGVYILKFEMKNQVFSKKFIIK